MKILIILILSITNLSYGSDLNFDYFSTKTKSFVLKNQDEIIKNFCIKLNTYFKKYDWGDSFCDSYNFNYNLFSNNGDPLISTSFGNPESNNRYLILCSVHGDEITPVKFCFDLLKNSNKSLKDAFVTIAPIVSPDSFLKSKPTRTNANGIDINRNFPTKNWDKLALKKWKYRYRSNKRRFPGHKSNSEPETQFQIDLIKEVKPSYIISVHSPLTLIDYDGPSYSHNGEVHSAKTLLEKMSKKANHYRIKDYPVFPGSLGNYAGYERSIPTLTLELPSSDPSKHKAYWNQFKKSFYFVIADGSQESDSNQ